VRISLNNDEVSTLIRLLYSQECDICQSVLNKLQDQKQKPTHPNKIKAAEKARRSRTKITKKKVENAVNMLRLYGERFGFEEIAIEAEVSIASAKKYASAFMDQAGS